VATIVSETTIDGPAGPIFDLITSARFWSQWYPATSAVFGVTERPYRLGDVIHERVNFAGLEIVVSWRVEEHVSPTRVVLQAISSTARITYSLAPKDNAVDFRRELEYDEALLTKAGPRASDWERLMKQHSEEGVRRLKEVVERILREEQVAPLAIAPA
jgi:hypothetical protein